MKIYKVVFANNEPMSCKEITDGVVFDGSYHYVHTHGRLIYAIVKGESELEALNKVAEMVVELSAKYPPQTV
jgi:hypothetical protein